MIKEDFVSFEVAKLLKEKGFSEPIWARYEDNNEVIFGDKYNWNNSPRGQISAPTHQMAMKWLREKDIIIVVHPEYFNAESKCVAWGVDIWVNDNYEKIQGDFLSYEEAVEAALKYSLKI